MGRQLMDTKRRNFVKEMSDLRKEKISVKIYGNPKYYKGRHYPTAWGRIAIDKFSERVLLVVSGGKNTRRAIPEVRRAISETLWFGNSTLIIDYSTGACRVSDPSTSWASTDAWGNTFYYQDLPNTVDQIVGYGGQLYYRTNEVEGVEDELLDAGFVSFFWKADSDNPCGQSRITPADFALIQEKSYNLARRAVWADQAALPKPVINGLWEDADPEIGKHVANLVAGTNTVAGLPKDPDTGELLKIEEIPGAPGAPLLQHDGQLARDFAASKNITPYELGENTAQPPTAEAMSSAKESLILEVKQWEEELQRDIEAFFEAIALLWDEEEPKVSFENPAQISESTRMAAAVQAQSIWPQYRYSEAAAREAGLSDAVVKEIFDVDLEVADASPELLQES